MAGYFVLMQQVHDVDRYLNEYVPQALPLVQKHGGEVVVASFDAEMVEGGPPNSTIVLRFPDTAAAWAFVNDPDYQPAKELRFSITSRGQATIVPEFSMPA